MSDSMHTVEIDNSPRGANDSTPLSDWPTFARSGPRLGDDCRPQTVTAVVAADEGLVTVYPSADLGASMLLLLRRTGLGRLLKAPPIASFQREAGDTP